MTRTQIQFPEPLYRRLKDVAEANDWSLAEVVRRASELYVQRFPERAAVHEAWSFPTLPDDAGFLVDPADIRAEADATVGRVR